MNQKGSVDLDDDLIALKQELAAARRQRLRRQAAPGSFDGRDEVNGHEARTGDRQPESAQGSQMPPAFRDLQEQIHDLTVMLQSANPDVKDKILDALTVVDRQSFRKNLVTSIVLSTIFLIAGWLLSIVATPAMLTVLFRH